MPSTVWRTLMTILGTDFNIVSLDYIDSEDLLIKQIIQNIDVPFYICAWSYGGIHALKFAETLPHQVKGLISIAFNPKFIASKDWPGIAPDVFEQFYGRVKQSVKEGLSYFQKLVLGKYLKLHRNAFSSIDKISWSQLSLLKSLEIMQVSDMRSIWKDLSCRTLAIYSSDDLLVPEAVCSNVSNLSASIETYMIPDGAHAPFLILPEKVASLIKRFCYE